MQLLFLYYIIQFSIYMNLYFTVFTLHCLCQYIVVFLGYFWLSRLEPKNQKNHRKPQKTLKNKISNFKKHWFFYPWLKIMHFVAQNEH